jgi:hypothetical protein
MTSNTQLALVNGEALTRFDVMQAIDLVIDELEKTGDISKSIQVLSILDGIEDTSGHAKSRLLYKMYTWYSLNEPEENFFDYIDSVSTTTKGITAKRYVLVQENILSGRIPKGIQSKPMRDLIPIATCLSQGYEINEKMWKKIALCSNDRELGDVLRQVKGKQPRKSARVIKLSRDGSLNGWKDNKKYFLGFLNVKDAETDKVLAEFIEKIKIGAGIIVE